MKDSQTRITYLKDYRPPSFNIETTHLYFDLYEDHATVKSDLLFKRNSNAETSDEKDLVLHGSHLSLESLQIEGRELDKEEYLLDRETLTILDLPSLLGEKVQEFRLNCVTRIEPQNNTALEGLYKSKKMFCTQCEAEGFRRMTYYLDRPDVMSRFTTTIAADQGNYPVLLSNGNKIDNGKVDGDNTRHWVTWEDPFKKPSYLFALVAGALVSKEDSFVTCSGREIALQIFVEQKDLDKIDHAMVSLKSAMRWDEEVYGREYDLEIFMMVAVDDFNMGAMENKGLNIFNTSCVLANPATTTDIAFQRVEAVVAHEYFHNWSGNRVTCRDWFQLSLKEGFTVFRDSEFSADMGSRTVKRVEDVAFLKTVQFAEDAGPMAHSVRPDSYMEISNFYTVTVYEKGAEVVRMISLLLGPELFRQGSDLYFERHDGEAVTTEDFVKAMEDASGMDLGQFRRWYSQAGTPVLQIESSYDAALKQYTLLVRQSCPPSPGQAEKEPFYIPLRVGLLASSGQELPLRLVDDKSVSEVTDKVLTLSEAEQEFVFGSVDSEPIPSLLRGFSAPVRLHYEYSDEELVFLMVHDTDGFNRWNAAQQLSINAINRMLEQRANGDTLQLSSALIDACKGVLEKAIVDDSLDKAMVAHLLSLPAESSLIEQSAKADIEGIHEAREFAANELASALEDKFSQIYNANLEPAEFSVDAASIARRSLKNCALGYLSRTTNEHWISEIQDQFQTATNMTDQFHSLKVLVHNNKDFGQAIGKEMLENFYQQWQHEALVVDQWFAVQAGNPNDSALADVKRLMEHPAFSIKNPNKVRSLIGVFCGQNHINFHRADGSGYEFLADQVIALDSLNPQIAARLLTPLTRWQKYDSRRQALMQAQLQRIKSTPELSRDTYEVVEKSTV